MATTKVKSTRPYPPSWVNRYLAWLEDLPIPIWLSIALIYLIAVVLYHIAFWLEGSLTAGSFEGLWFFNAIWNVIGTAFILATIHIANRAVDKFAVLVPNKKKELELLRYQMTTIPARPALVLALLICALIILGAYFDPTFLQVKQPIPVLVILAGNLSGYVFAPILLFHGLRQLILVIKAYRMVDEINLFHLQPLYAFAGLSMTSSLFWVLILNLNFIGNYTGAPTSTGDILLSIVFVIPYIFLAFATFILPLWGIHSRIMHKKEEAIEENGLQIEKAHQTLYRLLNKNNYKSTADMEKSLASLYKMREQIEKVPTWPWNPATLRGFLSAVFLPLGLWVTQQVLLRLL